MAAIGFVGGGIVGGFALSRLMSDGGWGDLIGMVLGLILGSGCGAGVAGILAMRTRTRNLGASIGAFLGEVLLVYGVFLLTGLLQVVAWGFYAAFGAVLLSVWSLTRENLADSSNSAEHGTGTN